MGEKSIKKNLEEINKNLEEINPKSKKKKPKEFKLPFKARLNKKKIKDNWVTVIKINENKSLDFTREKIEAQTIMLEGVPRIATVDYIGSYKGKPAMIQPSWSVLPLNLTKHFQDSLINGSNKKGYALLLERMKAGILSTKKKMTMGMSIGAVIILAVIAYGVFAGR